MTWDMARKRSRELPRKYKQVKPVGDPELNLLSTWGGELTKNERAVSHVGDMSCVCGMRVCCCDGNGLRVTKHPCGCYEAHVLELFKFHGGEHVTLPDRIGKRLYEGPTSALTVIAYCDACKAENEKPRVIAFGCEQCCKTHPGTSAEYDAATKDGGKWLCAECKADELVNPELLPDGRNSGYGHTADGVPIFYYSHVKRGDAHVYFEDGGKPKAVYAGLLKRSQMLKLRAATIPQLKLGDVSSTPPGQVETFRMPLRGRQLDAPITDEAQLLMQCEKVSKADLAVMYPEQRGPRAKAHACKWCVVHAPGKELTCDHVFSVRNGYREPGEPTYDLAAPRGRLE